MKGCRIAPHPRARQVLMRQRLYVLGFFGRWAVPRPVVLRRRLVHRSRPPRRPNPLSARSTWRSCGARTKSLVTRQVEPPRQRFLPGGRDDVQPHLRRGEGGGGGAGIYRSAARQAPGTPEPPITCRFHAAADRREGSCGTLFDEVPIFSIAPAKAVTTGAWRSDMQPAQCGPARWPMPNRR